jgi:hypothetical protein
MNDREELAYGAKTICEELKRRADTLRPGIVPGRYEDPLRSRVNILDGVVANLDPAKLRSDSSLFVHAACFCTDGDLLSQWRGYGGGVGGFAIGFDTSALQPNATSGTLGGPSLERIVYDERAAAPLLDGLYDQIAVNPSAHEGVQTEYQSAKALAVAARIKHPGFREEHEYRLLSIETGQPDDLSFRATATGLVPFRTYAFPAEAIKQIVIGPTEDRRNYRAARQLVRAALGFQEVTIVESVVPFR